MLRIALVLSVCCLMLHSFPLAAEVITSYSVAPTVVEVNLSSSRSGFVIVSNDTDKSFRIQIDPKYFTPQELGFGRHINDTVAGIENIADSIVVSPKVVRLTPKSKRMVRFSVKPGKTLEKGEYRANFVFLPVEKKDADEIKADAKGIGTKIEWILELRIPFFGSFGTREQSRISVSASSGTEKEQYFVDLVMKNPTIWRYPGEFTFTDADTGEDLGLIRLITYRETEYSYRFMLKQKPRGTRVRVQWKSFLQDVPAEPGETVVEIK
ncbi:MAG: hypothetical protein PHQ23_00100 [Candidatus Wallbacteria bacterium]|nr:hypothetical protein [Candidatus Wallbacteria bacterium]